MLGFQPTTASEWYKLEHGIHGNFNVHTFEDGRGPKVGYEYLQHAQMADRHSQPKLLFHVYDYGVQAINQVAIALTSGEPE